MHVVMQHCPGWWLDQRVPLRRILCDGALFDAESMTWLRQEATPFARCAHAAAAVPAAGNMPPLFCCCVLGWPFSLKCCVLHVICNPPCLDCLTAVPMPRIRNRCSTDHQSCCHCNVELSLGFTIHTHPTCTLCKRLLYNLTMTVVDILESEASPSCYDGCPGNFICSTNVGSK
jgi:hypothetical protein